MQDNKKEDGGIMNNADNAPEEKNAEMMQKNDSDAATQKVSDTAAKMEDSISDPPKKNKKSEKKEKEKIGIRIKNSFTSRKFRGGAYSLLLSVLAIVIVVVINLIFSKMDKTVDLTSDGKFKLDAQTTDLLDSLSDNITVYYLVQSGDEVEYLERIFKEFGKSCSALDLEYKDPVLYPKFGQQFGIDDDLAEQSFIVVDNTNGRAKYVDYNDVVETEVDYSTYSSSITGIKLEGALDSALEYVTHEDTPIAYNVTGHGEAELGKNATDMLSNNNVTVNEIKLVTVDEIPSDCSFLIINYPASDFTADEITLLENYITAGGKAIININYNTPQLTNFTSFIKYYGVSLTSGIVLDSDSSNYVSRYPYVLLPGMYTDDITDSVRNTKYVLCPYITGMTVDDDARDTVKATKLIYTSETSYAKALDASTAEKQDGDAAGKFLAGIKIEDTNSDVTGKLVIYSSYGMFDDSFTSDTYGNIDILANTVSYLAGTSADTISVKSMSVEEAKLTLTSAQTNTIALAIIIVIPVMVILLGIIIVVRRRNK